MTVATMERPRIKGYRGPKRSTNARRVAEKVIEGVVNGRKVVLKDAIKAVGYSDAVASHPKKITEQAEYKEAMASYEGLLVSLRDKTLKALHSKDLPAEKLYDLTGLLKVTDHSTALAQGKSTENVATKAEVLVFGSEDFLARQLQDKNKAQ